MKCTRVQNILDLFLEDKLDVSVKAQLKEHLNQCARCKAVYEKWQQVVGILENKERIPLPENFNGQLHKRLVLSTKTQTNNHIFDVVNRMFWIPQLSIARAALGLLIIALPVYFFLNHVNPKAFYQGQPANFCEAPSNETLVLSFNINSKEELKDVTLTVNLPEELQVVNTGAFNTTDNKFVWQGDLLKGNNSILIKVKSSKGGEWQIKALLEKEGRCKILEKTLKTV